MRQESGLSLIDALAILALAAIALIAAMPAWAQLRSSARTAAGARHLAMTLYDLRWDSVSRGVAHGLRFERDEDGWVWLEVQDGNRNGIRTAEIRNGTDPVLSGPHRLENRVSQVGFGFPSGGPFPAIPPRGGVIENTDDPIRFGNADLVAFHPLGTASSGTVYVTDGRNGLYAIVLYGRTGRIRVWRYDPRSRQWTL